MKYRIYSIYERWTDKPTYYKTINETRRALYSKLSRVDKKNDYVVMDVYKESVHDVDYIANGVRIMLPNGEFGYIWRLRKNLGRANNGQAIYQNAGSYVLNKDGAIGKLLRPKNWEVEYR